MSTPTAPPATPPQRRETFWIDVGDHMPDDDTTVLVANQAFEGEVFMAWHENGQWFEAGTADIVPFVTHWMDIPEGPTKS